jgi:hypothetical protein
MKQPQRNTQQSFSRTEPEETTIPGSFEDILNIDSREVERPKPLPMGTYICTVVGLPRFDKSSEKQTPFVEFTLQPTGTLDDIDQQELDAVGGFHDKVLRVTFYLTVNSRWRLNEFLDNCGIDQGKMNWRVDQTPNCQVGAVVKHTPSRDNTITYANVVKTISL